MKDNCGIIGLRNSKNIGEMLYISLFSLQHRGQESSGIVVSTGKKLLVTKIKGLVANFKNKDIKDLNKGFSGIGHVRYSTTNNKEYIAQPLVVPFSKFSSYAVAHNGNLINSKELRDRLIEHGCTFLTNNDTEVINNLISSSKSKCFKQAIVESLKQIKGAYSLVFLKENGDLIAVKDPKGFRPLCLGMHNSSFIVASESCVLDIIGASFIREIEPGEMITIDENGLRSEYITAKNKSSKFCSFEYIYFSRPDTVFYEKTVHEIRELFGKNLAKESKINADIVIAVPDSGISAALGYSKESNITYDRGIIRNHYIGRTFIEPNKFLRNINVLLKLNMVKKVVYGKKVAVVDDSIVRATTSKRIVESLRKAGATEVHMLVSSPPVKKPCFYGIDTPLKEQLIAANISIKEICKYIEADSLNYLSIDGLKNAMPFADNCCIDCFLDS